MKYFDCDRTATAITVVTTTWPAGTIMDPGTTINLGSAAVATPLCLFAPTVGAALNQRIGRQVKVFGLKVRGTIAVPQQSAQSAADAAGKIRLIVVQDMQTNAAQMTSAQLMQDATAADTTIDTHQNPNNFGRFRVLKDKMFIIGDTNMGGESAAALVTQGQKRTFKFNIKFRNPILVHFNATNGGTVADIIDNSFHVIVGGDIVAGLSPTLSYYTRVSYKE